MRIRTFHLTPRIKRFLLSIAISLPIALIALNCYLLLKPTSKIERTYYLNEYEVITSGNFAHFLPKDAILAAQETVYLTEDATLLNDIRVKPGQAVERGEKLGVYNEFKQSESTIQLKIEQNAYEEELENLESALAEIERMGDRLRPSSAIDTQQIGGELSISLEAEIMQEESTSGAIAILKQAIAATERQLQIIDEQLQEAASAKAITSPITGSIGEIKQQDGKVIFEIHSAEQNLVTYVTKEDWQIVQTEQAVNVFIEDMDEPLSGVITEKQMLPATETLWYELMLEHSLIPKGETVYEIRINLDELKTDKPFATVVKSDLIIATYPESSLAPATWAQYEDELNKTDAQLYILGYDGKIHRTPITVIDQVDVSSLQALREDALVNEENESEEKDEDNVENQNNDVNDSEDENNTENQTAEEDSVVAEATPAKEAEQLKNFQARLKAFDKNNEAVIFSRLQSDYTTILSERTKNIHAPAFLPLPFESFSKKEIGTIRWQDVVKYLFY